VSEELPEELLPVFFLDEHHNIFSAAQVECVGILWPEQQTVAEEIVLRRVVYIIKVSGRGPINKYLMVRTLQVVK
jgi:hypothetical protein